MKGLAIVGIIVGLAVVGYVVLGPDNPQEPSAPRGPDAPRPPDVPATSPQGTPDVPPVVPPGTPSPDVPPVAGETARVRIRAVFSGTAPSLPAHPVPGDFTGPCGRTSVPNEQLLVAGDGGVANVVVELEPATAGTAPPAAAGPVVSEQGGCAYRQHVQVVRAGGTVRFVSADPTPHNLKVTARRAGNNGGFNQTIPASGLELSFASPERGVVLACSIHPWMSAYLCVTDAPYAGVTGPDGTLSFEGVPAGTYKVKAWHEPVEGTRLDLAVPDTIEIRGPETPIEIRIAPRQ